MDENLDQDSSLSTIRVKGQPHLFKSSKLKPGAEMSNSGRLRRLSFHSRALRPLNSQNAKEAKLTNVIKRYWLASLL